MGVLDLMRQRCSVRKFDDRAIPKAVLLDVLEAARVAPSACNNQPWHFIVLEAPEVKNEVLSGWHAKAPAVIVCCGDHKQAWRRKDGKDHTDIDLAIAVDHMTLAAAEVGLGTCWVCWFNPMDVAGALQLPDHLEPIALLPIGYPAKDLCAPDRHDSQPPDKGGRKPLESIVSWNGYSPS